MRSPERCDRGAWILGFVLPVFVLESAITRSLASSPAARFADASEFAEALKR